MLKIVIFGTGSFLDKILRNIDRNKCEIVSFLDNNIDKQGGKKEDIEICSPTKLSSLKYDYIIIASQYNNEIKDQLLSFGIKEEKIIDMFLIEDLKLKKKDIKRVLGDISKSIKLLFKKDYNDEYFVSEVGLCEMRYLGRKRKINFIEHMDYIDNQLDFVRVSSLEMISQKIYEENITGNVAELGVYRGDFSSIINELFYDRKLYLFDTFEGFTEEDVKYDKANAYVSGTWIKEGHLSDTTEEIVINKMKYKENCIINKGYFPDSAKNVGDERFCFVSIDADLFLPTYEGLKYFYDRLNKGGYIFIHDYNNKVYEGVKIAVNRFCKENNVTAFPLSDFRGTAVIYK